jgi:hypothetical protein
VQLRHFVEFQEELAINYCNSSKCRPAGGQRRVQTGLGANFLFSAIKIGNVQQLDMTETSKTRGITAIPYTFSLCRI